jgi:hypothetical protein
VKWDDEDAARLAAAQDVRSMLGAVQQLSAPGPYRDLLGELAHSVEARIADLKLTRTASGWRANMQCGSVSHRSEWA